MPRTTAFDDELASILGRIRASGTGIEDWVDPLLSLRPETPEEEEEKTGILSTLGAILHEPKRRVDIALNYYANPTLRDRVMRGEEPIPAGQLAKEAYVAPPDPTDSPTEQHLRGVGRGLMERWVDVSTDPVLFALPPIIKGAPAAVKLAAGAGFAGSMAKSAYDQADATYESYKREGWSPTTSEEAAKTAFDVGMLGTMVAGVWPRRRGAKAEPAAEEAGPLARRPPIPTRPIPPRDGIPFDVYQRAEAEYMRGRPRALPGEEPPGRPEVTVEPPPPPEPRPLTPRLPEVNVPHAPERMSDAGLLGQIGHIQRAIGSALSRGDIEAAQELRGHHSRLTDLYRTRRYSPEAQVGRLGDLMQMRDQLNLERESGPGLARELEINESLAVLDAEINLARSAQQVPPVPAAEAPPTAPTPGAPAPAAPPPAAPAPGAPAGPIPSRSPKPAGPGQPVQELVEGAQAQVSGMPGPSGAPLAGPLAGGEPAGMAARAGAGRPAPAPLPGMPGGPPLDVTGIVRPGAPAAPRLGAVAPIYPTGRPMAVAEPVAPPAPVSEAVLPPVQSPADEEVAAADAVDAFLAEQGLAGEEAVAPAPAPAAPPAEPPPEAQPVATEAQPVATEAQPPSPRPMQSFEEPTKALTAKQSQKKSNQRVVNYVKFRGKNFWTNAHIMMPAGKVPSGIEPMDITEHVLGWTKKSVAAQVYGWQVKHPSAGSGDFVWLQGTTPKGKKIWAALEGDYFRTMNKAAQKNEGAQWRIVPPERGKVAQAVMLTNRLGTMLLGSAAPLNEEGPPGPIEEAPVIVPPEKVPPRMRQAAADLEAELSEEEPPPKATDEQKLDRAVHFTSGADKKLAKLRNAGASDEEISEFLKLQFGEGGTSALDDYGSYSVQGGPSGGTRKPAFYPDSGRKAGRKISGKALVDQVRSLYDIPQPKEPVFPDATHELFHRFSKAYPNVEHSMQMDLLEAAGFPFDKDAISTLVTLGREYERQVRNALEAGEPAPPFEPLQEAISRKEKGQSAKVKGPGGRPKEFPREEVEATNAALRKRVAAPTPPPTPSTEDEIIAWAEGPDARAAGFTADDLEERLTSMSDAAAEDPDRSLWTSRQIDRAIRKVQGRKRQAAEDQEEAQRVEALQAEQARLKEERAARLAEENERLREEADAARDVEEGAVDRVPEEMLPRPGEEPAGEGGLGEVPARQAEDVGGRVPRVAPEGDELGAGERAGVGRGPAEGEGRQPRSVTTTTPADVPVEELRADGETRVVEPAPKPARKPKAPVWQWKPGALEESEGRSLKAKATANLEAIRALKALEAADGTADPTQQEALAQYVGWGGMPRIFKEWDYGTDSEFWQDRHKELKELLTPEEYEAAQASVTNAHYTREEVIRRMWGAVARMGGGRMMRVLEPSMGVGNFISAMPDHFRPAHVTGVELDPITGRIAKRLFPGSNIRVGGFEATPTPDGYFDLAISNVPFGPFGVADPAFKDQPALTSRIHNYFFAKTLEKLRPGGVMGFITSHGTMDAKNTAFRQHMADNAWFLGGVRLPQETFQRNANTQVTTDILFFQRPLEGDVPSYVVPPQQWVDTVTREMKGQYQQTVNPRLNAYFDSNPEAILGELKVGDGTAGPEELTVGGEFSGEALGRALEKIGAEGILKPPEKAAPAPEVAPEELIRRLKPGNLVVQGDGVRRLQDDGTMVVEPLKGKAKAVASGWVPIRDAAREVIATQLERGTDADLKRAQTKLNRAYDAFTKKHGPLHGLKRSTVEDGIALDPDFPLTMALEDWQPPVRKGRKLVSPGKARKRDIFTKRTVSGYAPPTKAGSPREAYQIALAERGHVDVERIAGLIDTSPAEALGKILGESLAFEDPAAGNEIVPADTYLSGNVRQKLEQAEAASDLHPERYKGNVDALKAVQPEPLTAQDVTVQLGAPWVPADAYAMFAATELGGKNPEYARGDEVRVRFSEGLGQFQISWDDNLGYSAAATSTYGTSDINALELFEKGMNLRQVVIRRGQKEERVVDLEATALAQDKLQAIKDRFSKWIWEDDTRAQAVLEIYNRDFNNTRLREPDGSHLSFPGINRQVLRGGDLAPHQKNDVWRILTQPNTLIAEPVGSGKTWTVAAALMEAKRTGQVRKPIVAVPNDVFQQWGQEWSKLYPQAKLLIVDPSELTGKRRAVTMSRIATEEWDGVLVTHEALKRLPVSAQAMEQVTKEEIALLDQTLHEIAAEAGAEPEDLTASVKPGARRRGGTRMSRSDTKLVKEIEKQKQRLKVKLKKLYENAKRDKTISFDELGVDMLVVDEAHYFNNLFFPTKLGRVKGIANTNSDRAFDLYVKVRTLQRMQNGRGVVFATATPVRNTLAEMYTLFRYLAPDFLRERGLRHFDSWVQTFATPRTALELNPTGSGYRTTTRFASFVNVPELLTTFRNVTAVMTPEDLKLPVPEIAQNSDGKRMPQFVEYEPSDGLRMYVESLNERMRKIQQKLVEPEEDNPLVVTSDGRKAAISLAMVGTRAEPEPGSKLHGVADKVYAIWKKTKPTRAVQAVFLDLSTPDAQPFSAYQWLARTLKEMGVPEEEIDFVHNYDRKTKMQLFEKLNSSQVRIVLGSTKKMGVGANFQKNLKALHHVDVPWTPDGLEQRNGRGVRQGNVNDEVEIYNYVTKGTFDAYMWQLISTKAGFIGQVMTGKASARKLEDVSLTYLTAQEALAATSENPLVVKKIQLEADVRKYKRLLGAHQLETHQNAQRRASWVRTIDYQKARAKAFLEAVQALGERKLEVFAEPVPTLDEGKVVGTHDKLNEEAGQALEKPIGAIAPGVAFYYVGRFRDFGIAVRKHPELGVDALLPVPGATPDASTTVWKARYGDSGLGLLRSMEASTPKETDAEGAASQAVKKQNELDKLTVPEFKYGKELAQAEKELEEVNAELKTEADDAAAVATEGKPGEDAGDYDEETDYEAGERGPAREDPDEPDVVPPAAGGAGGKPPKPPKPGDGAPSMPSEGPQPGDSGWNKRVEDAKARNRKRAKGGQANAGVDPMHMADIAVEGADIAWRGARSFGAWSRRMMRALGSIVPGLKGMLRGIWNWVRQMFRGRDPEIRGARRPRPDFETHRRQYEEATAGQRGAGRKRYPWEEREIPPEEVRKAAEEGARFAEEPPPEYGRPPKADINFDRIGGEPDIRAWQARVVESLRPQWGKVRSFRTWKEARQAAVEAGLTERDFIRLVKERGAVTDIEIEAGRMMRQEAAEGAFGKLNRLRELQERRRTAKDEQTRRRLDEEIMEADREYRDALARYSAVTASTVEAAAEVARALNIHRKMAEAISPEEQFFRQILRKVPSLREKLRNELADAVMQKDAAKLMEIARKINKPSPMDYATEWFVNSLLSGLTTLEVNVLGNLSFEAAFRTPERAVGAGLERLGARQWVEKIFGKDPLPRQRFGREFEEALRQHITTRFGMGRALKYAWEFLVEEPGLIGAKAEYRIPAFKGTLGKIIRTPSRMMYALDLGSRWAAMEAELSVQAVRRAIIESRKAGGWTRDQVTTRMRELQDGFRRYTELENRRKGGEVLSKEDYRFLQNNPMYGRWKAPIREAGAKATFTDRADRFSAALMQMREVHPWMTFFAPFIRTPSRILAAAMQRSPYAVYDVFRRASKGELAGGELTDAMARMVYGNMIGAGLYLLAREGFITGSGPTDPRERSTLMKTGWQPYAAKVGDTYVSLARLEPFGTHLGWAADLAETQDAKTAGEVYDKLVQGISMNIVNKTYLQGPIGLAEALGDPERYGANLGRKTLGAFVPNLLAQAARAIDPNVRETDTIANTMLSRIPVLSKSLPPRRRGTGEVLTRDEHPLSRWLNPFRYATEKGPEANLERIFIDVGYIPSNAPRTVTIPGTRGRKVKLTQEERDLYGRFKERATMVARNMAQNEQFLALDPWAQEDMLKRIYRYAHDAAHRAMVASAARRGDVEWVE
jgi:N12 class adenine-specific DNA methylase